MEILILGKNPFVMKNIKYWFLFVATAELFSFNNPPGENYLITASISHRGVEAGMKILNEGGSAVDAALSVALSEVAETGGKYVSYAGAMDLVYYENKTGKIYNMNACFNTVQDETDPLTIPSVLDNMYDTIQNTINGRTILVPGFMKGLEEAHKKFGKIPFDRLFENAIKIAEEGTEWTSEDHSNFSRWINVLTKYPATKAVFTKPDGTFYQVGETFKQPALAKTLRTISKKGAGYMYKGDWAEKFVVAARNAGSKITLKDMHDYDVIWTKPTHGTYKGYDIYIQGEPDYGAYRLLHALNIAEEAQLSELGNYTESPSALATVYNILAASAYSAYYPDFYGKGIEITPETMLEKNTSKQVWEIWKGINNMHIPDIQETKNEHTAAIVSVDKQGNVAVVLHTIKAANWGYTGLFVDGISIPDPGSFEQQRIKAVGPGNRLPEGTVPGLVLKDGKPVLGFGCISGGAQLQTFVSLINVLDFKMTPQEAIERPGIGDFIFEHDTLKLTIEPNKFSDSLIIQAKKYNASFSESNNAMSVFWTGICIDEKTRELQGTKVWLR